MRIQREQRVICRCRVQFQHLDLPIDAESEDLSKRGVFVRTDHLLPVGAIIELVLTLPDDSRFRVISRVAHLLSPSAARAVGRRVGMGFEFLERDSEGYQALVRYLDDLIEELTPPPITLARNSTVLVADPSAPMRERLAHGLEMAGFRVIAVGNGAEAYAAIGEELPDLVLADAAMPVMDGWTLVKMLVSSPRAARLPVVLMSEDASDMTRLRAYRLGARDFIHKPFTDEEVVIRLRRLALQPSARDAIMLRGNLAQISVATLLSLMEFERKSGILVLLRDAEVARIFLADGRVVKIEGPDPEPAPLTRMMRVLDWSDGNFEFSACEVVGSDELGWPTSQLLLEHARVRDEENR